MDNKIINTININDNEYVSYDLESVLSSSVDCEKTIDEPLTFLQNIKDDETITSLLKENTKDDEALSSLLLLLKNKEGSGNDNENIPSSFAHPSDFPSTCILQEDDSDIGHNEGFPTVFSLANDEAALAVSNMTMDELRPYFHEPLGEIAQHFQISLETMKRICRQKNIKRWPYRQIRKIRKNIQFLQHNLDHNLQNGLNDEQSEINFKKQIAKWNRTIDEIMTCQTTTRNKKKRKVNEHGEIIDSEDFDEIDDYISMVTSHRPGTTRKARTATTYDVFTGWVAACHTCGKEGKYRPSCEGRPFQHSKGNGKYCGYFRLNPRPTNESGSVRSHQQHHQLVSYDNNVNNNNANNSSVMMSYSNHHSDFSNHPLNNINNNNNFNVMESGSGHYNYQNVYPEDQRFMSAAPVPQMRNIRIPMMSNNMQSLNQGRDINYINNNNSDLYVSHSNSYSIYSHHSQQRAYHHHNHLDAHDANLLWSTHGASHYYQHHLAPDNRHNLYSMPGNNNIYDNNMHQYISQFLE